MEYLRKNFRLISLGLLAILNLAIWASVIYEKPRNFVKVSFFDVGQGDSLLITGRTGNQVLIDAGSGKGVLRQLGKEVSFFDRFIDVSLATHPDKDHIGGFPHIFNRFKTGVFIEPGVESENFFDNEIDRMLGESDTRTIIARKGMILDLMDGSYLEILFPDRDVSGFDTNDASIIARYVYGDTCFILTGDAPEKMENYITQIFSSGLKCQVLKVGHHGSNTSTSNFFLSAVSPEYAVVSAGENNSYGHPHRDVVDRLTNFGIKILETSKEGSITFHSDGQSVRVK